MAVDLLWATKPGLCSSQSSRYPTLIEKQMTWNKEFPGGGGGEGGGGPGKMSSTLGALQFLRNAEFISFPRLHRRRSRESRRGRRRETKEDGGEKTTFVKCSSTKSASLFLSRFVTDMKPFFEFTCPVFPYVWKKKMEVRSVFVSNPFGKLTFV